MSNRTYIAVAGAVFCGVTAIIHGLPGLGIGFGVIAGAVYLWDRSNID